MELQAFAVLACERLADGLGSRRARFELARVAFEGRDGARRIGFERGVRRWAEKAPPVPTLGAPPVAADRLTLHLLTPVRIKSEGRLVRQFDFRLLASRMLRRVLDLAELAAGHSSSDYELEVESLLARVELVRIVATRTRWADWQRYSNRQGASMKLGGVVGELDLEGDLAPFSTLLRAAEIVHVGKGATFGLGRVAVRCP